MSQPGTGQNLKTDRRFHLKQNRRAIHQTSRLRVGAPVCRFRVGSTRAQQKNEEKKKMKACDGSAIHLFSLALPVTFASYNPHTERGEICATKERNFLRAEAAG